MTAAGALALAACTSTSPTSTSISPTLRPDQPSTGSAARPQPSEASRALSDYYSRIQQNYLAQGLLRVDGGGPDTPFTERQLVANFIQIALFTEFTNVGGRMVRNETETELHRWEGPIRMKAHFGSTVPLENRQNDEAQLERFAARLSRITGLPISLSDQAPNFHIFILNEDERRVLGPDLRAISSEIVPEVVNIIENMRQTDYCLALGIIGDRVGIYEQAVIVIRAEHPDLLRLSCIHEELAQGLGLPVVLTVRQDEIKDVH
ncbi:MAG: DUF2927 domain-containing protein, partial [Pseudomonadota bacterium]